MFRNRNPSVESDAAQTALACIRNGIEAAHPETVIDESIEITDGVLRVMDATYGLDSYNEVLLLGGGNAAGQIAEILERTLGSYFDGGVVVTDDPGTGTVIEHLTGKHPVPSTEGVEHTREVLARAVNADEHTLVLAVISGGASALLTAPAEGVTLDDLQTTTEALLESGADIHQINTVRKHLSAIKGGQLAQVANPATVVGIVFSDVVGNDLSVIGSGPTVPDRTTYNKARTILDRYDLTVPASVAEHLEAGDQGEIPGTPDSDDPVFDQADTHILCDNFTSLAAARAAAIGRGYETVLLSSNMRGESRDVSKAHAGIVEEVRATGNPVSPPAVLISGGETTVTVSGEGRGGPNLEFALEAAVQLRETPFTLAAVDTDGIDGTSGVAGALVDHRIADPVDAAETALANNDTLSFLADREAVLDTGPTGTNVSDLRVFVVE